MEGDGEKKRTEETHTAKRRPAAMQRTSKISSSSSQCPLPFFRHSLSRSIRGIVSSPDRIEDARLINQPSSLRDTRCGLTLPLQKASSSDRDLAINRDPRGITCQGLITYAFNLQSYDFAYKFTTLASSTWTLSVHIVTLKLD